MSAPPVVDLVSSDSETEKVVLHSKYEHDSSDDEPVVIPLPPRRVRVKTHFPLLVDDADVSGNESDELYQLPKQRKYGQPLSRPPPQPRVSITASTPFPAQLPKPAQYPSFYFSDSE